MPAGRPRKTVDDCLPANWKEIILEMCANGKSEVQIRAALCLAGGSFSHNIWYALQERDEEFCETIKNGRDLCQAWWESKSQENVTHGRDIVFETGNWSMNMKNRFKWTDRVENTVDVGENAEQHFKAIAEAIVKKDLDV